MFLLWVQPLWGCLLQSATNTFFCTRTERIEALLLIYQTEGFPNPERKQQQLLGPLELLGEHSRSRGAWGGAAQKVPRVELSKWEKQWHCHRHLICLLFNIYLFICLFLVGNTFLLPRQGSGNCQQLQSRWQCQGGLGTWTVQEVPWLGDCSQLEPSCPGRSSCLHRGAKVCACYFRRDAYSE